MKRLLEIHRELGNDELEDTMKEILDVYESAIDLVKVYRGHKKDMNNIFNISQKNEKD